MNRENKMELWLQFLSAESEEDYEMLIQSGDPAIQKAVQLIYDYSEDAEIMEAVRLREKALHDEASLLQGAKDDGREEGRAEGREAREAEMVKNMKAAGFSESDIRKALCS